MSKSLTIFGFIGVIILFLGIFFFGSYNNLIRQNEQVKQAWSQVENVYQRRLDLIPNLVETVKGYAEHERSTFQAVIEARAKASQMTVSPAVVNDPEAFSKFQSAQSSLSFALGRLLVVMERYPELKANQNFLALQAELEGTENRIAVERRRFNDVAQDFNTKMRVFPNVLIANVMGFKEKAYFKSEEAASKAPKVKF